MNAVLQNLLKLQALEFSDNAEDQAVEAQANQLRALVPPQILGHYDRLRLRGKKGVALVRNHVCTGCHMQQPIGKITVLMRDEDIQLCDSCGRYLYLEPEAEAQPAAEAAVPAEQPAEKPAEAEAKPAKAKAPRKPRKPRKPLETVA